MDNVLLATLSQLNVWYAGGCQCSNNDFYQYCVSKRAVLLNIIGLIGDVYPVNCAGADNVNISTDDCGVCSYMHPDRWRFGILF